MAYDETDVYQDGPGIGEAPDGQGGDAMFAYDEGRRPDDPSSSSANRGVADDGTHTVDAYLDALDGSHDAAGEAYDATYADAPQDDVGYVYQDEATPAEVPAEVAPTAGAAYAHEAADGVASVGDILADAAFLGEEPATQPNVQDEAAPGVTPANVGVVFAGGAPEPPAELAGDANLAQDATRQGQSPADATAALPSAAAGDELADIDDFPLDASVDLLPNTQVIQPASTVSSIANLSYDEDADSKAAIAALQARRKKRRRTRVLRIALVCALTIAGIAVFAVSRGLLGAEEEVVAEAPATVQVVREDFVSTITSQGSLKPVEASTVTAGVEGTLSDMRVAEGDVVSEGDVLFVIRNEALDKALSEANSQLSNANSTLTTREAAVRTAYNAYNAGVDAYNAGDTTVDIAALRAAITAAEAARDDASSAVTAARDAVSAAQQAVDKCTVKSPRNGTVVAVNADQSNGAAVSVEVADVSQLKTTVQVNEMDISLVDVGQEATFTFSALPDLRLTGTVDSIASMATGASATEASYGGVVTFGVTLVIPLPDPQLKPGMTATATILTEDVPDALVLPLTAVDVDPDDPSVGTVNVVTDLSTYATEPRTVTLGARSTTEVVVTNGVDEGDLVTLSGYGVVSDVVDDALDTMEMG